MREKFTIKFILFFAIFILIGLPQQIFAQSNESKQQLVEKFQTNSKSDHKIAYGAAKEFLQKFPDETSDIAQYMRKWVAAYEKVELPDARAATPSRAPEKTPGDGPTLGETIQWLKEQLAADIYTHKVEGIPWITKYKILDFKDGILKTEDSTLMTDDQSTLVYVSEVPLSALYNWVVQDAENPVNGKCVVWNFKWGTITQTSQFLKADGTKTPLHQGPNQGNLETCFNDAKTAERVGNAVHRLVDIVKEQKASQPF